MTLVQLHCDTFEVFSHELSIHYNEPLDVFSVKVNNFHLY